MRKYPQLCKSMVYKRTKHTKINKYFHTKHGKNTRTQDRAHTRAHTLTPFIGSHAHNANKEHTHARPFTHTHC